MKSSNGMIMSTELLKKRIQYFGILNHIKLYTSKKLARQLYFAFIYPHIKYVIEAYGACAKKRITKLQTIQNKLLKLLLKVPQRTRTNEIHRGLPLLKVNDIYKASLCMFVYDCLNNLCPPVLRNYFVANQHGYHTRRENYLSIKNSKTELGRSRVNITAANQWNNVNEDLKQLNRNPFKRKMNNMMLSTYTEV